MRSGKNGLLGPLLVLLLFAASVRLYRPAWDQQHFFHPDERAIGFAMERLSFSPLQLNPHFFAYGSLPLYVIKVVTTLLAKSDPWFRGYDGSILTGRVLSGLWGTATVVLLTLLGTRLYGRRVGLLAGFLLAATVLHVQNSHFATSDIPLTFLILLALFFLTRLATEGRFADYLAAGFSAGLAIATKFSALPILLPLTIAVLYRWRAEKRPRPFAYGFGAGLLLLAGFFVGQPYAVLDFPAFRNDILEQSRMVRHAGLFAYTNQYVGVPKYWYDLGQLVLWGMGPLLGLVAIWGVLRCLARGVRRPQIAEWVLLAWVLPFFAITGSFDVKFPRYLLPIYPLLILWAAVVLEGWAMQDRKRKILAIAVVATTVVWLAAFLRIYTRPHSVVTASAWFYANVPAQSKVVSQEWDEGFPFPLPGDRSPDRYRIVNLPYYETDSPQKIEKLSAELASAEYAVFQTKRIYGAVTRAPAKFPLTVRYFQMLFAGDLGFTLIEDIASRPGLFGLEAPDELADESFTVYDHPKVLVFQNTGHLPAHAIRDRILNGTPSRAVSRRDMLLASAAKAGAIGSAAAPGERTGLSVPEPVAKPEPEPEPLSPTAGLDQPRGIALDRQGRVYVCDFGHNRIQVLGADHKVLTAWGRKGTDPGDFDQPSAVAVAPDGTVVVADTWNGRIQEFDPEGRFKREWKDDFYGPRGVAVSPEGDVLVADTGNRRIVRFSSDGTKQAQWGAAGPTPVDLVEPMGLAVDKQGRVFVCDNGAGRLRVFDRAGQPQRDFAVPGWERAVFSEPQVVLDREGALWLTVPLQGEVRRYGSDGSLRKTIRGRTAGGETFERPMGIALAPSGDALYVTDLSGKVLRLPIGSAQ